jgi:hypothetical protein
MMSRKRPWRSALLASFLLAAMPGEGGQTPATPIALENEYVRVTRGAAPCASGQTPECADRVIVGLGDVELRAGRSTRALTRGDVAVFRAGEAYELRAGGPYFEVTFKANHPPVKVAPESIPAEKNVMRFDDERFFIFEERLAPGETRARHSHNQRVVIQLNRTRLLQWPDGEPEVVRDIVPDGAAFNPPVIHKVKNIGEAPLRGIVIEFKAGR